MEAIKQHRYASNIIMCKIMQSLHDKQIDEIKARNFMNYIYDANHVLKYIKKTNKVC